MISKSKKIKLLRILKWFSIVSALTLSLFAIFILTFDVNQYKGSIEKSVSQLLNRQVELRGDISMGLSLIPTVVVNDVYVRNVEWSDTDYFAVINKLVFKIELPALVFDRQLRILAIELSGANIILEKNRNGDNNWSLARQRQVAQSSDLPDIRQLSIENFTIRYRMPDRRLEQIDIETANAVLAGDEDILFEVNGMFREEAFVASLDGKQSEFFAGGLASLKFALQLEYRGLALSANADIASDQAFAIQLDDIRLVSGAKEQDSISINEGSLRWGGDSDLQLSIAGQYMGTPLKLNATAGSIKTLLAGETWPVKSTLSFDKKLLDFTGTLSGKLIKPVLEIQHAMFGNSQFMGKLTLDRHQQPMTISGELISSKLDIDDFKTRPAVKSDQQHASIRLPDSIDLDLQVKINALYSLPLSMTGIEGRTRLSGGVLQLSRLKFSVPSGDITGSVKVDSNNDNLKYSLDLSSRKLDVSNLMRGHKISGYTVTGKMNAVSLAMQGQTRTFDELLPQSLIQLKTGKSQLTLRGRDTAKAESLLLDDFQFLSEPKKPVRIDMKGRLRDSSFDINLLTADLVTLQQPSNPLPIELTASFADHQLLAKGTLGDMQIGKGMRLDLELKGQQLRTLGPLFKTTLIKMGPYVLKGHLGAKAGQYHVTNIAGNINQTDVSGSLEVLTGQKRPMILASLTANKLYYHDIFAISKKRQTRKLIPAFRIPARFLNAFNANIDIRARQFLIDEVKYENLVLHADLQDGVLKVDPLDLELEGSKISNDLQVVVASEIPATQWKLKTTDSDYGRILKSLGLTDKVEGLADVDIDLQGHGATLQESMANADGQIRVIAGKGKINNPKFDLWAAGLLTSMLSSGWKVDEEASVQCIIGKFDIKDGLVTSDTMMLDTSKITVAGTASINLKSQKIDAVIQPAPKNPSLVSLANPVKLSGNLYAPVVTVEKSLGRKWGLGGVLLGLANPGTLLLMYSDLGTGVANPCYSAALNREAKEAMAKEDGTLQTIKLPYRLLRDFSKSILDLVD